MDYLQRQMLPVRQAEMVVIELVCFVPQTQRVVTHAVDGAGDGEEMLKEFRGDVLIDMIVDGQFGSYAKHVEAIHRHPTRAVGLVDEATSGQRTAAVKAANVVQTEEAALKNVSSLLVLAVDPPREIQQQLLKHALQKRHVARVFRIRLAALVAIDLKHPKRRPGMHRRIHVAKRPLVGRQLTVRVHVPLARQQDELTFGKFGVNDCQRETVEGEIPSGEPGVLPLVRHRENLGIV